MVVGIRKVAGKVNNRLKNLILEGDDEDVATDQQEEANIRLAVHNAASQSEDGKTSPTSISSSTSAQKKKDSETAELGGKEKAKDGDKARSSQGDVLIHEPSRLSLLTVLGVLLPHMKFTAKETRLETLRWVLWLHNKLPTRVGIWAWSGSFDIGVQLCGGWARYYHAEWLV